MSNSTENSPAHILIFPYPAQGHMLPMLDLTHQLALHGLTLTILITPKNLPILTPLLSAQPSIQTLVLPFPPHPSLPAGVENVRDIGNSGNLPIINALGKLQAQIIRWFEAHPTPPVAILSDFFLGWTHRLGHQLGIPRIVFYSSGAFLAAVYNFLWQNNDAVVDLPVINFPFLPRSPSFTAEHLPSLFRRCRGSDPDNEFIKDGMIANSSSWGSVFNSFDALESEYLGFLGKNLGHGRVWGVGPLSLVGGRVDPERNSGDGVLEWLDGCPDGSVLHVCFGSQKLLKRDQIEALALGLEKSGARFIWVMKSVTAQQMEQGYGFVPDGFEDRVSGRGMVIKGWASQVSILSHRAVGGFLSHCGWNSVLEAIVAGVMILCWPMEADQFVNARLLVDDMGVAVRVCEGTDTVPDPAELAPRIASLMEEEIVQKVRAKELREEALEAVKEGGSSWRDLEGLVRELAQLQLKIV
ncbi:LOW QUALITY PROTEIN: UDP-glycosyltransferase 89A2-like [Actinidia eriantha]|uniref:LOW QUALITY PROTEIN: UDP-glycosyltransferase 89A2-like n=1 Tax=Actinidia eriantha TaxID=165200 RepID=UPI00258BC3D3|nr:LOW QUALITY PROTEIN: UDP-glycosyltransferase 89A2-like [Actinidia eriantha]